MSNQKRQMQLRDLAALSLPLFFGFVLRFYGLDRQGLFLDEAFSADLVLRSWPSMVDLALQDVHPLLFYSFLKVTMSVLPTHEWTLRLFPALCSTLSLALAIGLTRRLAGIRAAIVIGWMLAWSSMHLYYAQEARMYSLLEVLWLVSPWLLLSALRSPTWLRWLGWAVVTGAAIHTQFYGLVLWAVGALGSGAILLRHRSWREFRFWSVAQVLVLLISLPLVMLIISTVQTGVGGTWIPTWRDPLKLWNLVLFGFSPVRFQFLHGDLLSLTPWSMIPEGIWLLLAVLVTVGALVGWRLAWTKGGQRWTAWLVFTFGLGPVIAAVLLFGLGQQALWSYRPFIGASIWLLVGLAVGWAALSKRMLWGLLAFLFVLNLGGLAAYETQWVKDYGRAAFQSWPQEVPQGTSLVLSEYYSSVIWGFYEPDEMQSCVFVIEPRLEGPYGLKQIVADGTLMGGKADAGCEDLAGALVSLYDPPGRRIRDGESWPACLHGRPGWLFNPDSEHWEQVPALWP